MFTRSKWRLWFSLKISSVEQKQQRNNHILILRILAEKCNFSVFTYLATVYDFEFVKGHTLQIRTFAFNILRFYNLSGEVANS